MRSEFPESVIPLMNIPEPVADCQSELVSSSVAVTHVPVPVNVTTVAGASTRRRLPVLTPQTSGSLTEHETIGVDDWEDTTLVVSNIILPTI